MYNYKIVDNFLDESYFASLKALITSNNFPWFYQEDISIAEGSFDPNLLNFGFSHVFFRDNQINSNFFANIEPLLEKLSVETNCKYLLKARADLTVFNENKHRHRIHKDLFEDHITAIFYINNTTAETVLYKHTSNHTDSKRLNNYIDQNEESFEVLTTICPRENRLLYFNGNILHTGHSPSDRKNRILLNFNLI